jgi:hypothetical protein
LARRGVYAAMWAKQQEASALQEALARAEAEPA